MQIIVIAVLIVIAGLIVALLACATSLINRVRAANTTLRRIEEALLSLNRVKVVESAVKSAEPLKQSPTADAGGGFLTIRELKMTSSRGLQSMDSSPIPKGPESRRTRAPTGSNPDQQSAIGRKGTLAVRNAKVTTHDAVVAARKTEAAGQNGAAFAKRDPWFKLSEVAPTKEMFRASENPAGLDSSFQISYPRPDQQILSKDLRKCADDAIVHVSHMTVTAVAQKVPTANGELPIQKAGETVEEAAVAINPAIREFSHEVSTSNSDALREPDSAPTMESAAGLEVPEVGQGGRTAPTSNALDEGLRKKKEQELLMIISSRRRRARAGR
jgi:hypothetical protein